MQSDLTDVLARLEKITPGPWTAPERLGAANSIAHQNGYVAFVCSPRTVDEARYPGESWLDMRNRTEPARLDVAAEQKANRDAIALLPELIAVAKAAAEYRAKETDDTPRLWRGKELQDFADKFDAALSALAKRGME